MYTLSMCIYSERHRNLYPVDEFSSYLSIYLLIYVIFQIQLSPFSVHHGPPTPPIPASHPQTNPLWLCPCVLYTCSLVDLPLFSHIIPPPCPLWLLSVCSLFQCLWLYFACLFILLIRFYLSMRSYGICLSLPGLFHLA